MRPWRVLRCAMMTGLGLAATGVFSGLSPSAGQEASAAADQPAHAGPVRALAVLRGGESLVSGGFDASLLITQTGSSLSRRLRFHDSAITVLLPLGERCFASGGEDARIALWCGDDDQPARILSGHTGPVAGLSMSHDGRLLASASWDGRVLLYALSGEGREKLLVAHEGPATAVAFTRAGDAVISAGFDGTVRVTFLEAARAPLVRRLPSGVNAMAALPDGSLAIAGADGRLRVLDERLLSTAELELDGGALSSVALSPDARHLAVAGPRTQAAVIDIERRTTVVQLGTLDAAIWSLAFSQDGRTLYAGGGDGRVRRFDVATGKALDGARAADTMSAQSAMRSGVVREGERGADVFRACAACHGLTMSDGPQAGPTLHGVFGRRIASVPGYPYSQALRQMDIVWTAETISKLFEVGPATYTPGTKMPEQRLTDPQDRKALVEWLAAATKP